MSAHHNWAKTPGDPHCALCGGRDGKHYVTIVSWRDGRRIYHDTVERLILDDHGRPYIRYENERTYVWNQYGEHKAWLPGAVRNAETRREVANEG